MHVRSAITSATVILLAAPLMFGCSSAGMTESSTAPNSAATAPPDSSRVYNTVIGGDSSGGTVTGSGDQRSPTDRAPTTQAGDAGTRSLAPVTVVPPTAHSTARTGTAATTDAATTSSSTPSAATTTPETPTRKTTQTSTTVSSGVAGSVDGKVVVIDPGHNGANAAHPEIINKHVPAGFGATKACNTTGTSTNAGYAEHAFNWGVATALRDLLTAQGITVVMTRAADDGVGPCVNKRAAIGNDANADAVISIHGDGEKQSIHGFFVMTASRPPADKKTTSATDRLAADIRDALVAATIPVNNVIGTNGIWPRSDLAGLNLSLRPTVMLELGNMRNPGDAEKMSSQEGQYQYAAGIAPGIVAFLAQQHAAG